MTEDNRDVEMDDNGHQAQSMESLINLAKENLNEKLKRLPKRLFPGHCYPTITDIIKRTDACNFLPIVHPDYDLEYYFNNYNWFASRNFQAEKGGIKTEQGYTRAIWYLQLDYDYSFSVFNEVMVYNLLALMILHACPGSKTVCDWGSTINLREYFQVAFLEANMRVGRYENQDSFFESWHKASSDFIKWNSKQLNYLSKAVRKLREAVVPMPFEAKDFWKAVDLQPIEERNKYGAAWAMRWLIHLKVKEEAAHQDAIKYVAQKNLANNMEALEMKEDSNIQYDEIKSNGLFWALLDPIDRETRPEAPQRQAGWMDAYKSCSIVDGTAVDLNGLADWVNKVDLEANKSA